MCRRASHRQGMPSDIRAGPLERKMDGALTLRDLRRSAAFRHGAAPSREAARACRRCRAPTPPRQSRARLASSAASRVWAAGQHRARLFPAHHADPVIIGDDNVAGMNRGPRTDHRNVHAADGFLDSALGADRRGPDQKTPSPASPVCHARPHRSPARGTPAPWQRSPADRRNSHVARRRRGQNHDVARLQLLYGDMNHPVVAGWRADGHGTARDATVHLDRPHPRGHEAPSPLRLVHRCRTCRPKPRYHLAIGPLDTLDHDTHVLVRAQSSSTVRGKIDWNPSAYFAVAPAGLTARIALEMIGALLGYARVIVPEMDLPRSCAPSRRASCPRPG